MRTRPVGRRSWSGFLTVAWLCIGFAGCGTPSPTGPDPSLPLTLRISGPATVAPGATANFQAQLVSLDLLQTRDVTALAEWLSSDPQVAEIRGSGQVYGRARGEVNVIAKYDGQICPMHAMILEDGTFKLTGRVVDANVASSTIGVAGAVVEVLDGIGTGLRATSNDATGAFTLYGVAGTLRLGATAPGYAPASADAVVTGATNRTISVALTPTSAPDVDLSGPWTVTLTAGSNCTGLPDAVRSRDYSVTFVWSGRQEFQVQVSTPSVATSGKIVGRIVGHDLTLSLWRDPGDVIDSPSYALLESIQPKGLLGVWGTLKATLVDAVTNGSFDGGFDYYPNQITTGVFTCTGQGTATLRRGGDVIRSVGHPPALARVSASRNSSAR